MTRVTNTVSTLSSKEDMLRLGLYSNYFCPSKGGTHDNTLLFFAKAGRFHSDKNKNSLQAL